MNLSNLFNGKPKTFDVSGVKYKKPIDDQIITRLTHYFQSSYKHSSKDGLHKIMVGIDGELNCLVAAKLLKQAVGENVMAMIFDISNPAWTNSIVEFCKQLKLDAYILKRGTAYQDELATYHLRSHKSVRHFYKRFIDYHLLIQSDNMKAAVVDTIDKSDRLLSTRPKGFYGHFRPFYSLYKSEIFELAKFLGIPDQFILPKFYQDILYPDNVVLTWDKINRRTVSFQEIDPVLFLLTEKQLEIEDISQQFNIDLHWLRQLKYHINKQISYTTTSQLII